MLRVRYELEMDLSSVPDLVQRFGVRFPGGPPQATQRFDRPASEIAVLIAGGLPPAGSARYRMGEGGPKATRLGGRQRSRGVSI